MGKDTLRERPIREAVIHEPKKGLLPKKSCLKKRSDFSPAAFQVNEVPVHNKGNISRSNGGAVAASVDTQEEEKLQNDILMARIRRNVDLPCNHNSKRNSMEGPNVGPSSDNGQTHSQCLLLKRKIQEADEYIDRPMMGEPCKMARMSKNAIRKYIQQKVQDANRALVLEDMAGKLSQCAR